MNLYNLVLWMVDRILSYSIARFPLYLRIRVTSNFLDVIIFAVGFNFIQICTICACTINVYC
jgi:hypothetical protein